MYVGDIAYLYPAMEAIKETGLPLFLDVNIADKKAW
jgi:hypothetical protein